MFNSSKGVKRGFCGRCGTPITYDNELLPDFIDITTATLDDGSAAAPTCHIWLDDKPDWVTLTDDLPTFPGWPPLPA